MKINMRNSNRVTIDGKDFVGRNVTITNGTVTVDGKRQPGELIDEVNITVHGDVDSIENSAGTVTAQKTGTVKTQSGDVRCGDVSGSVSTMSGDVTCGSISGSTSTMSGDIRHR